MEQFSKKYLNEFHKLSYEKCEEALKEMGKNVATIAEKKAQMKRLEKTASMENSFIKREHSLTKYAKGLPIIKQTR